VTDLGPLEMRVLGLLEGTSPQSVVDVQHALRRGGADLAYTTVMTVLGRLYDKGLVTRTKQSRRYLYATARSAPRVKQGIFAKVRRALFQNDRLRPIVALLDEGELSDEELRSLRRMIDHKIKDKPR
jgi:predicted transcriptional regulator